MTPQTRTKQHPRLPKMKPFHKAHFVLGFKRLMLAGQAVHAVRNTAYCSFFSEVLATAEPQINANKINSFEGIAESTPRDVSVAAAAGNFRRTRQRQLAN